MKPSPARPSSPVSSYRIHKDLAGLLRLLSVAPLVFFILLFWIPSHAQECAWAQLLISKQNEIKNNSSPVKRNQLRLEFHQLRQEAAQDAFKAYLNGSMGSYISAQCLEGLENTDGFMQLVQTAFLRESLLRFRDSKNEGLRRLVALLEASGRKADNIVFGLAGEWFGPSPTDLKAGVHRLSRAVFMDISRIEPREWYALLIHELAHVLDRMIPEAVTKFSSAEAALLMAEWAARTDDPAKLPAKVREPLKNWLQAGLDRGLLSEVRAWAVTFALYTNAKRSGTLQAVDWLENMIQHRRQGETWDSFALRYLHARSRPPTEGLFVHPLARRLLDEVIKDLQEGKRPLESGALKPLLTY